MGIGQLTNFCQDFTNCSSFSVGGMISLSGCMAGGITMVIRWEIGATHPLSFIINRDKFSASNYWKDCVKYKVWDFQLVLDEEKKQLLILKGDSGPIHWGDLPVLDKLSSLLWGEQTSSEADVWQRFEAGHLDPVCFKVMQSDLRKVEIDRSFQVWNRGHLRVLRFNRGEQQHSQLWQHSRCSRLCPRPLLIYPAFGANQGSRMNCSQTKEQTL